MESNTNNKDVDFLNEKIKLTEEIIKGQKHVMIIYMETIFKKYLDEVKFVKLDSDNEINPDYKFYYLYNLENFFNMTYNKYNLVIYKKGKIPLVSLEIQNEIIQNMERMKNSISLLDESIKNDKNLIEDILKLSN